MKKKVMIALATIAAVAVAFVLLELAAFRVTKDQAAGQAAAQYGTVVDETFTKGSILLLLRQPGEETAHIVIYERCLFLPRYRLCEVIPFSGQQGNFGHADRFQRFSFRVSEEAITVYPESVTSVWFEPFRVKTAALPLVQGETKLEKEDGLPRFARLKKVFAE